MKKLMILLLCLCICLLAACAKENVPSSATVVTAAPSEITASSETGAEPAESTEAEIPSETETASQPKESSAEETSSEPEGPLSVVSVSARLHHDSVGNVWLRFIGACKNTGDTPLQLDYTDVTLSAAGTEDVVLTSVEPFPQVIAPGETGYYCEMKPVDLDDSVQLTAAFEPPFSPAETPVRYETEKVQVLDSAYGLEVRGLLEKAAMEEKNMVCVAAVLLDGDGAPIAVLSDYLSMDETDGSFTLEGNRLPEEVRAEDVARCLVFAYPYEV